MSAAPDLDALMRTEGLTQTELQERIYALVEYADRTRGQLASIPPLTPASIEVARIVAHEEDESFRHRANGTGTDAMVQARAATWDLFGEKLFSGQVTRAVYLLRLVHEALGERQPFKLRTALGVVAATCIQWMDDLGS